MTLEDLFTLASLTASIRTLPLLPTKIGSLGLFAPKPIRTTQVVIDEEKGKLSLVANTSRRAPGNPVSSRERKTRSFTTTHLPERSTVLAEDVQGLRSFESEDQVTAVSTVVAERLQDMKNNLVATREWQRMGAIKGQILDADGVTVIEDLYDTFGVTQVTKAMNLSTNTAPRTSLMEIVRQMDLKCGSLMISKRQCLCSGTFLDALVENDAVKRAYDNWNSQNDGAASRLAGDVRSGFVYAGIEFIEYTAVVSGHPFIADGEAYLFPAAQGLFVEALAPANYSETVNTLGLEFYAKAKPLDFDKGYDMEAQTNPLPLCLIPAAVFKLTA